MKTPYGHLSYCSNIHTGEIWAEHFAQLQAHVPAVKTQVSPNQPMGLGLRFANQASIDLQDSSRIGELKTWLKEQTYTFLRSMASLTADFIIQSLKTKYTHPIGRQQTEGIIPFVYLIF